jgi:HAD superfamily hydrolase (TIGR01509 family)
MIKAVVFDCFGVLATDAWLPFRNKYFGNDKDLFTQAVALNRSTDSGAIGYDEFIKGIAQLAGLSEEDALTQIGANVPDAGLFEFIEQKLKPQYKIGLLSNAADNWLHELFTPLQVSLFDAVGFSYEIGAIKPAPITYMTIAERLSVDPSECIFTDDQIRYCEGAEAVGMQAIQYTNSASFIDALASLL